MRHILHENHFHHRKGVGKQNHPPTHNHPSNVKSLSNPHRTHMLLVFSSTAVVLKKSSINLRVYQGRLATRLLVQPTSAGNSDCNSNNYRRNSSTTTRITVMPRITHETINDSVKNASYAVRGPIVSRSMEINDILRTDKTKFPFTKTISCNIDAVARANQYLEDTPDVGSYTDSQGIRTVRAEVSQFLQRRDGYASDPNDIFLTNGASEGVRFCMQTILRDPASGFKDGVLTPIPQYPLYSALTTLLQGNLVPYYLDESKNWSCTPEFLTEALERSKAAGISVRALVVINPGNPTGQILPEELMRDVVDWCKTHGICLMADEVYQENIWKPKSTFVSFRKVAYDMKAFEGDNPMQMISFHSISKGFLGECGFRGGYFEILGFPEKVKQEIYKLASIALCSNTIGQVATGLMVNPPREGEEWYETYVQERDQILASLQRRAEKVTLALNTMEGVSCTTIDGAMYAFPTITLPAKAIEAAKEQQLEPDAFYCLELLERTGIVVVPGSGFGQKKGTYHFRTTILPPEENLDDVVALLKAFHTDFLVRFK